MPWIISIFCIIIIGILVYKLYNRQELDKTEYEVYQNKLQKLIEEYKKAVTNNQKDLDQLFQEQRKSRQKELDEDFARQEKERKTGLDERMEYLTQQAQDEVNKAEANAKSQIEHWQRVINDVIDQAKFEEEKFNSLLEPLRQYEKQSQERIFHTIQVPEEYRSDIEFLLTTIPQKIQHPDVINKLVWTEYIKPYLDDTCKRVGITDNAGIYKLTNIQTNKSYIGKSTNVKKRIADHFKSSIGIKSIADQAVHHEILRTGIWNWTIEILTYCDKDKLSELEKYYIGFFKTQEFGFNKNSGG